MQKKAAVIALLLSLVGVVAAYLVTERVFQGLPHVEDEMAYVWQAEALARGRLTVPTPPEPQSMQVPFVVDHHGARSAKYPPGWPMLLALGLLLGIRPLVNPLLAGLALWLTYRLGAKLVNTLAGLLASLLLLTSPLFLINSGSLLSEPWSLVLSLAFILAWLDLFEVNGARQPLPSRKIPHWMMICLAGLSLGLLALTRPLTALGVALPFFIHGLVLLWRGPAEVRSRVILTGAIALLCGLLVLLWQYGVTGNPLTNPYTLWWSFDRVGFGPGIGTAPGGFTFQQGLKNAEIMLAELSRYLFGWGIFSWIFLPSGIWAVRRNPGAWLALGVFICLVLVYIMYWAWVGHYGPRYYYEGLPGLTLVSAAGILWLAGMIHPAPGLSWRSLVTTMAVLALILYNILSYLPPTLTALVGFYGVSAAQLEPFQTSRAQSLTPALVIVHVQKTWTQYAGLLELENPWLTSPFIFAESISPTADAALIKDYPTRRVFDYYPDQPDTFYARPR
jgi:4-amino-4-deoxy-L-arabinose transferase-like glycosyltransferase